MLLQHGIKNPREAGMIDRMTSRMASATGMSRRAFARRLAEAGLALAFMPALGRGARAEEQAIYFTWTDYNDPKLFPAYMEKNGAPPDMPIFGDVEEALQKIRAGFVVDVVHPCSGDPRRWRLADLLAPIDTGKLSNWPDVFDALKTVNGVNADGKQWFVPFDWGQTSITYRPDLVDLNGREESWGLLWDERYKGKLASMAAAEDAWYCAAIYAGLDVTKELTMADVAKVGPLLEKQRPLLHFYSTDTTSVEQALASGEVVAAMTWNQSPLTLKSQGINVKFANPKEGALTWCCGLVLMKNAPHPDKAHELIDAMIDPRSGQQLITTLGYGHSNQKSFDLVSVDDLDARGLSKHPLDILNRGRFLASQPPEIDQAITEQYEKLKAGF